MGKVLDMTKVKMNEALAKIIIGWLRIYIDIHEMGVVSLILFGCPKESQIFGYSTNKQLSRS